MRLPAAAGTLLATLAISASASAGLVEEPNKATVATTGDHSELIESLPVSAEAGANERVAMSLGRDKFPTLEAGDRLRSSG